MNLGESAEADWLAARDRAVAEAVAQEREACARTVEDATDLEDCPHALCAMENAARLIRNRGNAG